MQDPTTAPVVAGTNWAVLIPVIVTGLGILLGQVLAFLSARAAKKETQAASAKVDAVAVVTDEQTNKLNRIEVLVDGRYGEVLQQLADVKRLLAAATGTPHDQTMATEAQTKADEQHARVAAAPPKQP